MTAYTLQLKKRKNTNVRVTVPIDNISAIIQGGNKDELWDVFKGLTENPFVHDKRWLEMIVNWSPKEGLPLTAMSKWLPLAKRVAALDDTITGNFTLSQWYVDLIWDRLNDKAFILTGLDPQFAEFLLDFMDVTGKRFPDGEPAEEVQK